MLSHFYTGSFLYSCIKLCWHWIKSPCNMKGGGVHWTYSRKKCFVAKSFDQIAEVTLTNNKEWWSGLSVISIANEFSGYNNKRKSIFETRSRLRKRIKRCVSLYLGLERIIYTFRASGFLNKLARRKLLFSLSEISNHDILKKKEGFFF